MLEGWQDEGACMNGSRNPLGVAMIDRDRRSILMVAFLGLFLSGYNNFIAAIALLDMKSQLKLTPTAVGMMLAAVFVGMLIGGLAFGHAADRWGRRPSMIVAMMCIALFAVLSGLAASGWQVIVLRLLMGVGIGAGYPIGSTYVADISPPNVRGANMTLAFCGWGFGALACGIAGWWCTALFPAAFAWRVMLATGALPALAALLLILQRKLPESHAWKHAQTFEKLSYKTLISHGNRRRTAAALLPWFLMDLPVYGVGLLVPTLLLQMHVGGPHAAIVSTVALAAFTLVGFWIAYVSIDRIGRRRLQIIGFILMAALFTLLALAGQKLEPWQLVAVFAVMQICINAGPNTTTWIVAAEVFPTRLRARGQGSATAFSRIGAACGAFALPIINARVGEVVVFAIVGGASIVAALITWMYLPETARLELTH